MALYENRGRKEIKKDISNLIFVLHRKYGFFFQSCEFCFKIILIKMVKLKKNKSIIMYGTIKLIGFLSSNEYKSYPYRAFNI